MAGRKRPVVKNTAIELDLGELNPKQAEFCLSRTLYTAYGGARGGGKTHAVRIKAVYGALWWPGIKILILRKTYNELRENHIEPIKKLVPATLAAYNGSAYTMYFTNGSIIRFKEFDGVQLCYGFAGAGEVRVNADLIALKKDGKWGAADMNGNTVIPFDRDSADGIYGQSEPDYNNMPVGITATRYYSGGVLMNERMQPIRSDLQLGWPAHTAGDFFAVYNSSSTGCAIFTYTLEGERIAELLLLREDIFGVQLMDDFVVVHTHSETLVFDRNLAEAGVLPLEFDEAQNDYANQYAVGGNVLYKSDEAEKLHRTYLPDGTRLVTWYDPEMGEYYSRDSSYWEHVTSASDIG